MAVRTEKSDKVRCELSIDKSKERPTRKNLKKNVFLYIMKRRRMKNIFSIVLTI